MVGSDLSFCASSCGRSGICTRGRTRRPDHPSLVSHFTIASDGDERLRVAGIELRADSEDGYEVESYSTSDESHVSGHEGALMDRDEQLRAETIQVVSVGQPLSCLFKIWQAASAKSTGEWIVSTLKAAG